MRARRLLWCMLMAALLGASSAHALQHRVVLLYDERVELPGLGALDASIAGALKAASAADHIEIYREALDLSRFGPDQHLARVREYLRAKYEATRIDVVVAALSPSLDFLLAHGDPIFPDAAIVYCCIDHRELERRSLPPHVTGVILKRRFAPTLDLALRLQPGTERVVVVAGSSAFDAELLQQARSEFRAYEDRLAFEYLSQLSLQDVLERVSRLPPRTMVLFTTMFKDGVGQAHVPHQVIEAVAATANAPVYAFLDQFLGRGIVGGELYSLGEQGRQVAAIVLRILGGEPPSQIAATETPSSRAMFDARQLQRWRLDEKLLPAGTAVHFREQSLWSQYRWYVAGGATLIVLQFVTIASLLLQRSGRRSAELEVQKRRVELAHAGRLATLGQLTATIAHEVNQPLGAMLANVATAEMLLSKTDPPHEEILQILADIRKDDVRASEVIKRVRTLLANHEVAREQLDLNEAITEVLGVLRVEARQRAIELTFLPSADSLILFGDRIQIQQVVINLILNAMDAMSDTDAPPRRVLIRAFPRSADEAEVSVSDRGHGIPAVGMPRLFESFYTTKEHGMGLGLSISRSIIDAHGGRIWAEASAEGATFRFTLPRRRKSVARTATPGVAGESTAASGTPSHAPKGSSPAPPADGIGEWSYQDGVSSNADTHPVVRGTGRA